MAARVLAQRRFLAPLATITLGGLAVAPATVLAEGPVEKKKPIYDDLDTSSPKDAPVTSVPFKAIQPKQPATENEPKQEKKARGPSPTDRIAVQIGKARMAVYRFAVSAENKVNETMDSAFHLEQSFTNTIASLAPSRESGEKLMPGTIYVLVAAMAGSIITRRSNILLRSTVPLALGVGAGWTVLPVTMRNISDLTWKYEQRFPAVAETHTNIRESLRKGVSFAKVHSQIGVQYVDDKVTDTREAVESWVKQGK
ncbi:hypothetical protein QQS21_005536 [Conoideocrella luteorostrata]|uniref:MICOS complex subunit n=1 Tax=Conoideocrella luteorostrata TaxID=1105319 RepID=A0AAJ0G0V4_9HYPO|nr:hypothetical protein QQS21_005536 [Conoideocrella luteorostrata]